MTREQAIAAAVEIDLTYFAPYGVVPEQCPRGVRPAHIRWMIQQMRGDMSENKTMRWLGYIQGMLVAQGLVSLDEMKQLSMRHAGK